MLHTATSSGAPVRALLCLLVITLSFACNSGTLAEGGNDPSPQYEAQNVSADSGTSDDCDSGVWCPPPSDHGCGPGVFCPTPDAGVEVTVENFGARGEFTSPSFLTTAPPGAALVAQNVVVDTVGEYTTARGFQRLPAGIPGDFEIGAWTTYQGAIIAHVPDAHTLYRYVSGAWTAYSGTYDPPSPGLDADGNPIDGQVKFFETQQALYFTTALGVYRLEGVTETPTLAGVVQALPGVATVSAAGQALSTSSATAYRYVWGRRATNGRIMLGAPSSRVTISNRSEGFTFAPTAASRAVIGTVTLTVSSGVASGLVAGQIIELTAVDPVDAANFPLGAKTLTAVGTTTIQYAEAAGAAATATNPGAMSFTSSATAVDVVHVIPIPEGVDASYFVQVYRADEVPLNVTPSDEMYLVHEEAFSDMAPGATSYTFVDGTPDALKGDALYTNANSGGSIGTSHYVPPKATVTTVFNGRIFYGNTELKERINMTLLGVGGQYGLNSGQGLVFTFEDGSTETYTGSVVAEAFPNTFKIYTGGTPSQNVVDTLGSLTRAINSRTSGRVSAQYDGGATSLIGGLSVESRDIAEGAITVTALQRGDMWAPALRANTRVAAGQLSRNGSGVVTVFTDMTTAGIGHGFVVGQVVELVPPTNPTDIARFPAGRKTITAIPTLDSFRYAEAGTAGSSVGVNFFTSTAAEVRTDDEIAPGGFMVSDNANPDSVPATLPEIAGDRYKRILRMLQVGNALFFLKEDGLYRLLGTDPTNYTVDCVDPTIRFVAPRAAWVLNNRAYALTSQGLASWTESSNPEPAALQIEDQLRAAVEHFPTLVDQTAFAVAHESKRRAYLWLPDEDGFANARLHVFNATNDAWTRWTKPAVDAFIHPTEDRLWLANPDVDGDGTSPAPSVERNSGTNADYQDEDGNAIEALVTWTPTVPPESTLQQQIARVTYSFKNTTPTALDVSYMTDWVPEPLWWTLDASSSTSPGTLTTVPDQDHSRGNTHTLSVRHAVVNEPMRLLGFSAQARYWVRLIP